MMDGDGRIRFLGPFVLCLIVILTSCEKSMKPTTELVDSQEGSTNIPIGTQSVRGVGCVATKLVDWREFFRNNDITGYKKIRFTARSAGDVIGALRCAAEQGIADAQYLLAQLYSQGGITINSTHVPRNVAMAKEWRRRATINDPCRALSDWRGFFATTQMSHVSDYLVFPNCNVIGKITYADGSQAPEQVDCDDIGDIVGGLRCAANRDDAEAQYILARLYHKGIVINGVPVRKNASKAQELARRAAVNGHCGARFCLAYEENSDMDAEAMLTKLMNCKE